jgi:hypothetical protein
MQWLRACGHSSITLVRNGPILGQQLLLSRPWRVDRLLRPLTGTMAAAVLPATSIHQPSLIPAATKASN